MATGRSPLTALPARVRRPRAGVFVDDRSLACAVVTGDSLVYFRHGADEGLGAGLKSEIEGRQLDVRRARVGLRRARVIVKAIELPAASARGDLAQMVGFELERHVPFSPDEMAWALCPLPGPKGGAVTFLVAACERRAVDQSLKALDEARLRPLSVTVASHDLPGLLARGPRPARTLWAHRVGATTDLIVLQQGRLRLSRTVTAAEPAALAAEAAATAAIVRWPAYDALWISGDDAPRFLDAPEISAAGVAPTAPPWAPRVSPLLVTLPAPDTGAGILALAVALGSRRPDLDLLPHEIRPRRLSAGYALTAGTAAIALVLAIALFAVGARREQRYLDRLSSAIRVLDADVRSVEQIRSEIATKKRLLSTISAAERGSLRPLPFLRELTETVPADAWISSLSADLRGVEISGQAGAANQLIPLLEATTWLDRVEFTSPVTRGRDKEQFRLKAAWEVGPHGPAQSGPVGATAELPRGTAGSPAPVAPPAPGSGPVRPRAAPGAPPAPGAAVPVGPGNAQVPPQVAPQTEGFAPVRDGAVEQQVAPAPEGQRESESQPTVQTHERRSWGSKGRSRGN
ncbi:MAG TPA: PilN domain-containing protein [Candidatus Binatia bacterium]|nr:PilN domain-containing protein [Candidatus Binatia bacterium]